MNTIRRVFDRTKFTRGLAWGHGKGQIGDNDSSMGLGWGEGNCLGQGDFDLTSKFTGKGSGKYHRGIKYYAKAFIRHQNKK